MVQKCRSGRFGKAKFSFPAENRIPVAQCVVSQYNERGKQVTLEVVTVRKVKQSLHRPGQALRVPGG
jgi:hypothetical protein